MKTRDYVYEVTLRVVHHEPPNPDEPSLNANTLAEAMAAAAQDLTPEITVTVAAVLFRGEQPR
jgi:hypothetical protein